ncbi:MAG: hypothetical protein HON23_04280 [Rickettsiales bacterium]|jgi:uncharacterized Zn finger protein|nr:hypothetical protein [Rickettsiales bacterium]
MVKLTRTWWGSNFMNALNHFMEEGRLSRGSSYSGDNRILSCAIEGSKVYAAVRGNANPYYGIYEEPEYNISLRFAKISTDKWPRIIDAISSNFGLMSKLMLNEMPDNIEEIFFDFKENFLPLESGDISSDCSCPDWQSPCKHIAGVYFRVASMLDRDPFLMFQLRGISKEGLQAALEKTELGKALISSFTKNKTTIKEHNSFYTSPETRDFNQNIDLNHFWNGPKIIEEDISEAEESDKNRVSAILIKKQGEHPVFWHKDKSFIMMMEEVYAHLYKKNKSSL